MEIQQCIWSIYSYICTKCHEETGQLNCTDNQLNGFL